MQQKYPAAMEADTRSARNELFQEVGVHILARETSLNNQQLKPRCVELSQLALRDDGSNSSNKALVHSTGQLFSLLHQKCRRVDGVFDEKLADYVFFPLSQILKRKQTYTDQLSEWTIKSLRILLEYGWKSSLALDLAKQLLMLLTFVAGGVPGKESKPAPEELLIEAYAALAALFRDLANTSGGTASLLDASTIPALGHCVTVVLDGATSGPSADAQLEALRTLEAIWSCLKDPETLSTFLPGTISALTKCLVPSTSARRSRKVLVKSLNIFQYVLVSLLGDIRTRSIRNKSTGNTDVNKQQILTNSWLKATSGQIKLALSNVIRLRGHESVEVRRALNRLCITVLDECHDTLDEAAYMLVETCMILAGVDEDEELVDKTTSLIDLSSIHLDLGELIKNTIYNWVTSLPRVMQSNDEAGKLAALGQLSRGLLLIHSLNLESSLLEDALGDSLRDSVSATIDTQPGKKPLQDTEFDLNSQAALILASDYTLATRFSPVLLAKESQKLTRKHFASLLDSLGSRESQIKLAWEMLEYTRSASGPSVLSSFWLSSQILRSASVKNKELDEFFESSLTLSDEQAVAGQELFSYSLALLLNEEAGNADWRMQAIALEVIADTAQRLKGDFRTDLLDTLYPVAQLLGSPNPSLREHAIICLNIISRACGYANASELIVENADYMVNAISLRLDTFDVSPQAPQVLVMMIRLVGPSLLLYLDDVVGSIFAALENFHGYHGLVESLFTALGEIVSVGSKTSPLRIDNSLLTPHRKSRQDYCSVTEIAQTITKKPSRKVEPPSLDKTQHRPWKSAKELLDEAEELPPDEEDDEVATTEIAKVPPTKTYTMLQSIARLSQHYLTNASPVLRAKLLGLISTSSTALYKDEDRFLPLVNDIWPVVIKRLYDDESFVTIAAANATAEICRTAGDFLSTRISVEWVELTRLATQSKAKFALEKRGNGGRGIYSQASQVWEAIISLLAAIVGYVRIDDAMLDEVLELLGDLVCEREELRATLEAVNSDAVWLVLQDLGKNEGLHLPVLEGFMYAKVDIATDAS
jgi:TELO2-interacting protein 1